MDTQQKPAKKVWTLEEWEREKAKMGDAFKHYEQNVGQHGNGTTQPETPFTAISFVEVERPFYRAEVGRKDDDYIFHFFEKEGTGFPPNMEELLADVFGRVFSRPDTVCGDFSPELGSWTVRVIGYATNPLGNRLVNDLFECLDLDLSSLRS